MKCSAPLARKSEVCAAAPSFPVNSFNDRCCTDCGGSACGVPPGSTAKPGDWNATLMEASFDAIINETTLFHGGITGAKDQLVLVRGYPGPLGTPFAKITTTMPGPNPRGPNATITVPTWAGPSSSAAALAGGSVAGAWAQGVAAEVEAPEPAEVGQCGSVLHDYCEPHLDLLCEFALPERFGCIAVYYTWGKNRPDNDAGQGYAKTTADCCALCANHTGCEAFSFYKKGAATGQGICRLHKIPLPATVPGPASADYDSGNMKGPAPKVAGGPAPTPGPHPPPPPRPPAPPPPPTPCVNTRRRVFTLAPAVTCACVLLGRTARTNFRRRQLRLRRWRRRCCMRPWLPTSSLPSRAPGSATRGSVSCTIAWCIREMSLLVRSLIDVSLPTDGVQSGWAPCPKNPGACELQVHASRFPAS